MRGTTRIQDAAYKQGSGSDFSDEIVDGVRVGFKASNKTLALGSVFINCRRVPAAAEIQNYGEPR